MIYNNLVIYRSLIAPILWGNLEVWGHTPSGHRTSQGMQEQRFVAKYLSHEKS